MSKEYKDVLLKRHSMIRIQSKDHKRRTYEINQILLSCFDDKIYIQNNGYDELALGYRKKKLSIPKSFFYQRYCFNLQSNLDSFLAWHIKHKKHFFLSC